MGWRGEGEGEKREWEREREREMRCLLFLLLERMVHLLLLLGGVVRLGY